MASDELHNTYCSKQKDVNHQQSEAISVLTQRNEANQACILLRHQIEIEKLEILRNQRYI